ncbi:hypothetical protein F4820DRAFT_292061 [Hypoxylon rubiginosum]|uniref:Uncharacterized protein n=1 Tax=Hypoxylon rubiginosum TaxID=110542 RepID=A0ACB9Z240_9PEZI|nr:hypothetical protein F4820DRAFT_292061 [Hypoxylon rubiginosum]
MSASGLGPLVRLWGLRNEQLPAATASADELAPLLIAILQEAVPFIDSAAPKGSSAAAPDPKLWKRKGTHAHADSAARVEVLERAVPAADLERVVAASSGSTSKVSETWCCRRSVHADKADRGTASWAEFDRCFREHHAESERAFTPSCLAARAALRWDCAGVEAHEGGLAWTDFSLVVEEMRHRIGRPVLKDRTFPVLQMTCRAVAGGGQEEEEFVVVSIPVPDFARSAASTLAAEKGAQVATYVSVERIRKLNDGEGGGGSIEWLMATASDAGGALPAWVQNLAAPGVIWKDVPLFLGWIAKERQGGGGAKDGAVDGGEAGPQASTGVEVDAVPTVSGGDARAGATDGP